MSAIFIFLLLLPFCFCNFSSLLLWSQAHNYKSLNWYVQSKTVLNFNKLIATKSVFNHITICALFISFDLMNCCINIKLLRSLLISLIFVSNFNGSSRRARNQIHILGDHIRLFPRKNWCRSHVPSYILKLKWFIECNKLANLLHIFANGVAITKQS